MQISLEINGILLELEAHLEQSQLTEAGFKKVGFLTRLFLPFPKKAGDIIFFSRNPTIDIFNKAVQAKANLDTVMGAEPINGTSCYAIFNGDRLRCVICQVIQSNSAAQSFAKNVRQAALNELGEPTTTGRMAIWKEKKQIFKSIIDPSGKNAFVHWLMA